MSFRQSHDYVARPTRFLELWEHGGWRIKLYGISALGEFPSSALVATAKEIAAQRLPMPASTETRYGIGFVIVHEGADGDYVIVDWWTHEDIAQHHLYGAAKGHGGALAYRWPEGAGFCVWELAVCAHERDAWVKHMLARPSGADLDAYLDDRLNRDV